MYLLVAVLILWGHVAWAQNGATGTLEVSWEAPTKNTDGTDYTDPQGYRIYWGESLEALSVFGVTDPAQTTASIPDVPLGKSYHVTIVAVNAQGVMSAMAAGKVVNSVGPETPINLTCGLIQQLVANLLQTFPCQ